MSDKASELETVIAVLQAQRATLGDAAVDAAVGPLREKLAALGGATPQRRQVTVLFLDIVGSTELSQTLDPEDIQDIMDGALRQFSDIVVKRRGKVLQYAGDSLLAAFGADVAREDDAERAVHAGLDLLTEAHVQSERVRREHGSAGFEVRVGAHTGNVLIGGGVDEERSIRGVTVNLAARLEQTAPPGNLRISQDTWRHVRGVFEVQAQPPLQVKGHDAPLSTYLVLRAKPRAFRVPSRGIEGVETLLVGRTNELATLVNAFEATVHEQTLHAVTLVAHAGMGKSRLMHELQHTLESHAATCWLLRGRSQPSSTLQPYGLLRDVLAWRLQIADSDSADVSRVRLVEGLAPLLGEQGELQAELLGQLIGMDFSASPRLRSVLGDPRLLRDRALRAFTNYLLRLAKSDGSSVVMLLDDLHWADDASLDWLQQLLTTAALPLTLVMAARPEFLERRPAWGEQPQHQQVTLVPLDATQRQTLVTALLQRLPEVPAALRDLIETQAEGNPFYAEELVKMLIDDGVIEVDGVAWSLRPDKLRVAQIPGTLTGVLQARLDALGGAERRALQLASVIGPVFWDDALAALDPVAPSVLPALEGKAMVQRRAESAFTGTREESFQHHLLHQVTYDTVLRAERRIGHAGAAHWLSERVGDRSAEYLAITAEHYDRAGDTEHALDWYERAAVTARDLFANRAAAVYLARMLAMPELRDTHRRWSIARQQVEVADLLADRHLQREALDESARLAELLDDDTARASAAVGHALLADRLGDRERAKLMARRGAELAERTDAAGLAALAHGELSWLAREAGDLHLAHHHIDAGLAFASQAAQQMANPHDDVYEVQLLLVAAQLYWSEHNVDRSLALLKQARALGEQRQLRRVLCSCHEFLSSNSLDLFDVDGATRHLDAADSIAREIGQTLIAARLPMLQARLALLRGDLELAVALTQTADTMLADVGARYHQAECRMVHADALARSGDLAASRAALQRAVELFAAIPAAVEACACRLLIADTWRAEGDLTRAVAEVGAELPAINTVGTFDASFSPLASRMAAWRVLSAAGDPRAAHQLELAKAETDRRTATISDPAMRARVLNAPLHRELIDAWSARRS